MVVPYACVGELFRRSCVPGVLDTQYNKAGTNPVNLCEHCGAGGMDRCQRNTRELYYGDSGAFRCLVESMSCYLLLAKTLVDMLTLFICIIICVLELDEKLLYGLPTAL